MANQYTINPRTTPERFWSKVEFTESCWLWQDALRQGYGRFWDGSRQIPAHRYAYEFCVGPIPQGLELDHLCRTSPCVLPDHLEPVPHRVNCLRGEVGKRNALKTHCPAGHPYDEENTMMYQGRRYCRACTNERSRRRRARHAEAAL